MPVARRGGVLCALVSPYSRSHVYQEWKVAFDKSSAIRSHTSHLPVIQEYTTIRRHHEAQNVTTKIRFVYSCKDTVSKLCHRTVDELRLIVLRRQL
jgi:hypothetical protein